MTRLIIFDFDGTLGDTQRNIIMTLKQTMEAQGLPTRSDKDCAATIGLTLQNAFLRLFPQMTAEEGEACAATYREIFEVNKQRLKPGLFPHVKETLEQLHRQGIKMSVASSRTSVSLRGFLADMGIAEFFPYVIGAEDVARPKPHPEPVLLTLDALRMDASETLVVGDMPVDILMGAGAGCKTCGVTYGNGYRKDLEEAGADYVIDSMKELIGIVN